MSAAASTWLNPAETLAALSCSPEGDGMGKDANGFMK